MKPHYSTVTGSILHGSLGQSNLSHSHRLYGSIHQWCTVRLEERQLFM